MFIQRFSDEKKYIYKDPSDIRKNIYWSKWWERKYRFHVHSWERERESTPMKIYDLDCMEL